MSLINLKHPSLTKGDINRLINWEERYHELVSYFEKNEHIKIPRHNSLGTWKYRQKAVKDTLSKEQYDKLKKIGVF